MFRNIIKNSAKEFSVSEQINQLIIQAVESWLELNNETCAIGLNGSQSGGESSLCGILIKIEKKKQLDLH